MATIRQAINEAVERGNTCFFIPLPSVFVVVAVNVAVDIVVPICFRAIYLPTVN